MAFSKAKVLRFNDVQSLTPAPGAYNPKFDNHVVGACVSTAERFTEQLSVKSAPSDTQSVTSTKSIPCFRTPTLPRRKKILPKSEEKPKDGALFSPAKTEALREKIVECLNKDHTIEELENQLEELKLALNNSKQERDTILEEKTEINLRLEFLQTEHRKISDELEEYKVKTAKNFEENETLKKQYENIKNEFEGNNLIVTEKLDEMKKLLSINEAKLEQCEKHHVSIQNKLLQKCEEINDFEIRYEESLQSQAQLQQNHATEIDNLQKMHQTEVEDLEYEVLKLVTESRQMETDKINRINSLEANYKNQMDSLRLETSAHINQIVENCSEKMKLSEIQMGETKKEFESHWASRLKEEKYKSDCVLKECQAISEFTIIQSELEKNELKVRLAEFESAFDRIKTENEENTRLQKTISELQTEMSGIIIELNEVREALGNETNAHKKDLLEKRGYEIALNKIHDTVNALKNRLIDSDRDVEQLKSEIETLETTTVEIETRCYQVSVELNDVLEENDKLKAEQCFINDAIDEKVNTVKSELLNKVESLHVEAERKITELEDLLSKKQAAFDEVYAQLQSQQQLHLEAHALIGNSKVEIEKLEAQHLEQNLEIKQLKNTISNINKNNEEINCAHKQLLAQLNEKDAEYNNLLRELQTVKATEPDMSDICRKYIEQSGKYDALQQQFEDLLANNAELEKKVADQNNLIGPFRETLENYERELGLLLVHKSEAEKEAREMGLKYAEMLGHRNHKQKLKHLVDLKRKNIELTETKNECENKIMQQNRVIEKLKLEISSLQKHARNKSKPLVSDKENMGSPGKNQILSARMDSPVNVLKERN